MWDLIVSVPDHCLSFYFPQCLGKNGHGLSPAQRAMYTI